MIEQTNPDHFVTVTVSPVGEAVGRAWVECRCGFEQVFPSRRAATTAGLVHHHTAVGSCTCPPDLRAHPCHPSPPAGFTCGSLEGPGPCLNERAHVAPRGCVHHSTSGVPDRHDLIDRGDHG